MAYTLIPPHPLPSTKTKPMSFLAIATLSLLAIVLAAAVYADLRERRIPNALIVLGLAVATLLAAIKQLDWLPGPDLGATSFITMLLGLVIGLSIGFALFAAGAIGAGDGKLLGVIGAFLGPWGVVSAVMYGGMAGGLMALVQAARRHTLIPVLLRTRDLGLHLVSFGRAGERWSIDSPGAAAIPFAVPLAVGAFLGLLFPLLPGGTP